MIVTAYCMDCKKEQAVRSDFWNPLNHTFLEIVKSESEKRPEFPYYNNVPVVMQGILQQRAARRRFWMAREVPEWQRGYLALCERAGREAYP